MTGTPAPGGTWRDQLAVELFREDHDPPAATATRRIVAGAALVALGAYLSILRQTGLSPLTTVWAEDGAVFLETASADPISHSILTPYAGYLHVFPRLVAEAVVSTLPVGHWAIALTLIAALTTGAVAVFVWNASAGHLRSSRIRVALAALVVLLPTAGYEAANNIANSQWYLAVGAFWALLARTPSRATRVAGVAIALAAGLSTPLVLVLAPVAVARLVVLRSERAPAVALLVGAASQVVTMFVATAPDAGAGNLASLPGAFAQRVALATFTGQELSGALWGRFGWVAPAAAVVALGLVIGWLLYRRIGAPFVVVATAVATTAFAAAMFLRGRNLAIAVWQPQMPNENVSRHTLLPVLLLTAVIALWLDRAPDHRPARWWVDVRLAVLAVAAMVVGMDFFVHNDRSDGPSWGGELAAAQVACLDDDDGIVEVVTTPTTRRWSVGLPCDLLPPLPR